MKLSEKINKENKTIVPEIETAAINTIETAAINDQVVPTPEIAPESEPVPAEIPMSLDEFCRRWSETERRAALLGAFHFEMKRKNQLSGLFSNYRAAYADFINAPA